MADDDLGAWDDEDFAPPDVKVTSEYGEEIVKKVDEEKEKKEAEAAAAASQHKDKDKSKKHQKGKDKSLKDGSAEALEDKKLTPQELEDLQRAADLAAAAETFGISNSSSEDSIDRFEPKTKQDFDNFTSLLSKKIGCYSKNEHYHDFLSSLFTELCVKLDSEHIRRYGKELTALGAEKLKEEKEKEKQKQPKKKKPTLITKKTGDLDDVVGEAQGFNDYVDDDDFM